MMITTNSTKQRYYLIDALRGFALINMVAFHLMYDIFEIYGVSEGWYFRPLTLAWERFICISFIVLSGISLNFSKHAYKRGIIINICGFLVTIVTVLVLPNEAVWFGVLNFIGCAMLISQPLRGYFDKLKPIAGLLLSLAFFAFTYEITNGYLGVFKLKLIELPKVLYGSKYMAFLGFPSADFYSTDFFPLMPWIFMFIAGYFFWKIIKQHHKEKIFLIKIPVLSFVGKNTLWIYLIHQPLLMGICYLIFNL